MHSNFFNFFSFSVYYESNSLNIIMNQIPSILALESSCDETSSAVVRNHEVLSNVISSQLFHKDWGGVVPELASRAHMKLISRITQKALSDANMTMEDIDAIAVTREPGLIGSLIVGANFAKGLSLRYELPVFPVNHIEGHIFSGLIGSSDIDFPFITLVVSGGHTAIFLVNSVSDIVPIGLTRDDAAGEAFDKIAKMLGLGYPGGPEIDRLSQNGNNKAFNFPRSMINSKDYDFSFSGLKTSVRYFLAKNFSDGVPDNTLPDICASVQSAIVDVLVKKTVTAAKQKKASTIVVAGGVSANSELRSKMETNAQKHNIKTVAPELALCMDNAAMIGFIAELKLKNDITFSQDLRFTVNPTALRAKRPKA